MKRTNFLTLLIWFAISISSCTNWEDSFSNGSLYDTWEVVNLHEGYGLNSVATLIINEDRTFTKSITYRQPNSGELVGYYFFSTGSYQLDGNTITFLPNQNLFIDNDKPWGELDDLNPVDINNSIVPVSSTLEYRDKGMKLLIATPCNDVLLSSCAPSPIYTRADISQ
ncbi:hypothetical protein [Cyclobacterium qasimii]|uniref:Lipocalin-like domain-containing protein n=2 Tax=Cyclobacterium qasimii TaxID=1350429 RepID=S7VI26_9BACT|nr:hypothetical protein [Cyclobacterium qasimii]EPR69865.1 hypothetical protein ADICYQ_1199 [Cyclobacterium qasimii M12-11B]GEO23966.1 hypothetical protein CQA01_45000 [Cyclobacterium qasimii]